MGSSLSWGNSFAKAWGASFGRGEAQQTGGGFLNRPRRKFRPALLIDFPEEKLVLPELNAAVTIPLLSATLTIGSVVATSPDPINARTNLEFTQIEAYMRGVTAQSSWNDPTDEELLLILDFVLD